METLGKCTRASEILAGRTFGQEVSTIKALSLEKVELKLGYCMVDCDIT